MVELGLFFWEIGSFVMVGLLSIGSFVPVGLLYRGSFVNWVFCPGGSFVNWVFCQLGLLSIGSFVFGSFVPTPFCNHSHYFLDTSILTPQTLKSVH